MTHPGLPWPSCEEFLYKIKIKRHLKLRRPPPRAFRWADRNQWKGLVTGILEKWKVLQPSRT